MRLDRIVTLCVARPLAATGLVPRSEALPILMYHSISDDIEAGVGPYYRVATHPRRFAEQMHWLAELGYQGVSLEEALKASVHGGPGQNRMAVITFDDGFRDFHTAAWPVLRHHNFSATMYLPTGFIAAERKSFRDRECMTWNEIRELRAEGIEFGAHTVSHPELYKIPWQDIETEVSRSKEHIEAELDESISSFAYPYAFPQQDPQFVDQFKKVLDAQGYESCVTTRIGRVKPDDDRLSLRRLPVNSCDDRALFAAKLDGHYDRISFAQNCVRRVKAVTMHRRGMPQAGAAA
jgi:peptidoglycan/xylan/chitin deacetylase (PgdA/CDA1 family)